LDDQNREMLLEYLKQEYDKNPGQFPFPKELIEDFMIKEKQRVALEGESVKDIKSQEMVLEDKMIVGGGQEIEQELHEEDEEGAEYLEDEEG
jgi:hypothetical protein